MQRTEVEESEEVEVWLGEEARPKVSMAPGCRWAPGAHNSQQERVGRGKMGGGALDLRQAQGLLRSGVGGCVGRRR